MKLMAGSLDAVWKLFSEWTERELSCRPRGGALARGLCRVEEGGPGVRATGGSSPGEEGFLGIGAVRGAGRASVPVPESWIRLMKSQIIKLLLNKFDHNHDQTRAMAIKNDY